jgi:hypothetical protein
MNKLTFAKNTVSILLVLCFVLPLSKCTTGFDQDRGSAPANTYLYGYDMMMQGWHAIGDGDWKGVGLLVAVFTAFFVPVVCLKLKIIMQAFIHFCSFFPAAYILYSWVFLYATDPQVGGVLAVSCWVFLFLASIITIWQFTRGINIE